MLFQIERDFYDKALEKALAEDTPEEREAFRQLILEYEKKKEEDGTVPPPQKRLNHNSLKWFIGLSGAAVDFAKDLDLNLFMTVTDGPQGYIRFETSFFDLDDRHGPLPMAFWVLLTETADKTTITHCEETFRIEMYFDLYCVGNEE